MICDLDESSGAVALHGTNREQMSGPEWRRQVVYQAAEPAWWEATAGQHFRADQRNAVLALLPQLGLQETHLNTDITRLSTGERQRMALVRSLAMRPRVLLLDEPTASLDGDSVLSVEAVLREQLRSGLAIVLVTHSAEQASRIGDRQMLVAGRKEA